MLLLSFFLFIDFVVVGLMQAPRRRGTFDPPCYPITGSTGQFTLADPNSSNWIGNAMFIVRRHNGACLWAPTRNVLDVRIEVFPYDNSATTPADRVRIGNRWADKRGDSRAEVALFRAGGGQQIELRPWGYVHNSLAAFAALGFLACAFSLLRDRFAAARVANRISQGLCANCGYPWTPPRCPECGHEAPK